MVDSEIPILCFSREGGKKKCKIRKYKESKKLKVVQMTLSKGITTYILKKEHCYINDFKIILTHLVANHEA